MQAYPAYTWNLIDEELTLYEIVSLIRLWQKKDMSPSCFDTKTLVEIVKKVFSG